MNEKQLAKLIKKTTAKAGGPKMKPRRFYDETLEATRPVDADDNADALELFAEMKKREF